MQPFDPWRVVLIVLSTGVFVGFGFAAWVLRRHPDRERIFACFGTGFGSLAFLVGNYQRLSERPIFATFIGLGADGFWLLYLVYVFTKHAHRRTTHDRA